jgi:hypothetical protein
LRSYLVRKVEAPVYKAEKTAVEICHADHVTPSPQKVALTSPTSGGLSVGTVSYTFLVHVSRLRTPKDTISYTKVKERGD